MRAAVPAGIYRELSAHLLEIIGTPVGEDEARHFAPAHADEIAPWIEWADVVVIGPGLGKHADTAAFLDRAMPALRGKRVVVDGDALAWFAADDGTQVHLTVDPEHRPSGRAHTAIRLDGVLDTTIEALERAGHRCSTIAFDGDRHVFATDPAGNLWELIGA